VILIVFGFFAILIPSLFLLSSKLLRKNYGNNSVKGSPYESGEETIGSNRDIDNEYLPFFAIFIPFEIIAVLGLLWAAVSYGMSYDLNLYYIILLSISTIAAMFGYKFISDKYV
jgi:NADH:ubiquinone oxidoreductase subunit 3 (subunit A)